MSKRQQSTRTGDISGQHDKQWSKGGQDAGRHYRKAEIYGWVWRRILCLLFSVEHPQPPILQELGCLQEWEFRTSPSWYNETGYFGKGLLGMQRSATLAEQLKRMLHTLDQLSECKLVQRCTTCPTNPGGIGVAMQEQVNRAQEDTETGWVGWEPIWQQP